MSANTPHRHPSRLLPKQPNLERLRKQAKDLLEEYRAGEGTAVTEVEQYERHPDPKAFALHDAQRVLARSYGYESWSRLKAFVDGVNVRRLANAVKVGDLAEVRSLLRVRPELLGMDVSENNEHRALHFAVLGRDLPMVRLLMQAGADARKGIYPHRDATSALALASGRGYDEIVEAIQAEEERRREDLSCPNTKISPVQDQIHAAISQGDNETAMRLLDTGESAINACDRDGATPLLLAAEEGNAVLVKWLLERGANVRKRDVNGRPALDRAALSADPRNQHAAQFPEIARLLLIRGAELTICGAVALGDAERVRELVLADPEELRRSAPVDEPDGEPWATPQAWAEKMKRAEILAVLARRRE